MRAHLDYLGELKPSSPFKMTALICSLKWYIFFVCAIEEKKSRPEKRRLFPFILLSSSFMPCRRVRLCGFVFLTGFFYVTVIILHITVCSHAVYVSFEKLSRFSAVRSTFSVVQRMRSVPTAQPAMTRQPAA